MIESLHSSLAKLLGGGIIIILLMGCSHTRPSQLQIGDQELADLDLYALSTSAAGPSDGASQDKGLFLEKVFANSIWAKLGLKDGDRILSVNGLPGSGSELLVAILQELKQRRNFFLAVESENRKEVKQREFEFSSIHQR